MSEFNPFSYQEARFRIASDKPEVVKEEIVRQRNLLEEYLKSHPLFKTSLTPVDPEQGAPECVLRMARAAETTGVGPMAAVAGTMAQMAGEAALASGGKEAVIENGGDIFLFSRYVIRIGVFAGDSPLSRTLTLRIQPEKMPLCVCSSSSVMGHSLSFGRCDLATVFSEDGSLADAAATLGCNLVTREQDIRKTLDTIISIQGIQGILIVKGDKIGIAGDVPELIKNSDPRIKEKITRHRRSNFSWE